MKVSVRSIEVLVRLTFAASFLLFPGILFPAQLFASPSADLTSDPVRAPKGQPRIGLVLEGGGALGFAHVGILKVLEEEHIPVYFVAGTSMGSIVGAAYAAGRTPAEMAEVMTSTDWNALFYEAPSRPYVRYREKISRNGELVQDGKIGYVDGNFKIPLAIVQGQRIEPLLQQLYSKVPPNISFNDLPVPFRAVAADIETGDAVVLDHGNLAQAARASMAVPGFFTPVEIDGLLLVDGGIANNFPVDVVKEMGADVVIAVEFPAVFKKRDQLTSPISISGQILDMMLQETTKQRKALLGPNDILIQPDVKAFGATSFGQANAIMLAGEVAAREAVARLKHLAISPEEYQAYNNQRTGSGELHQQIEFVVINATTPDQRNDLEVLLDIKVGEPLDQEELNKKIDEVFLGGEYSKIGYEIVEKDGKQGIQINAEEKDWQKQYIRLGFALEDNFEGDSSYSIAAQFRSKELNALGAEAQVDAEIGRSPFFRTEWYQPIWSTSPVFIAPSFDIGQQEVLVRQGNDLVAEYDRQGYNGTLRTGVTFGRYGEMSTGYRRGNGRLERRIGESTLPNIDYDTGQIVNALNFDQLDSPDFPTSGYRFSGSNTVSTDGLGGDGDYDQNRAFIVAPLTFGDTTISIGGEIGASSPDLPVQRVYTLGGFTDISGYAPNSLTATDYWIGRTAIYQRLSESGPKFFGFGSYVGLTFEYSSLRSSIDTLPDNPSIVSGSTFVGFDTPILPAYLGFGIADEGERTLYLVLGRIPPKRR